MQMLDYALSLSAYERFLMLFGVITAVTLLIYVSIERFERSERGIAKKRGQTFSIITALMSMCLFFFLTLIMMRKGVRWYIAYPIVLLITLGFLMAILVIFGRTKKIRHPKTDYRMAIGRQGVVFKPIVPDKPTGCVSVNAFGQTIESYAISSDNEPIPIGSIVKVIDIDEKVLVCMRIDSQGK